MLALFAGSLSAAPATPHGRAKAMMAEAQRTANPVRLLMLALDIRKALDEALAAHPDDVEVRLDLVRFHTVTPRLAGGSIEEARAQAEEIFRRDEALGRFARGYIAYREKQFGVARIELKEAMRLAAKSDTRALAAKWLGWLSQESQQWDDAFAIWEELRATDPSALYEIARTASFCGCRTERGREALREYLKINPKDAEARKLERSFVPR
jgi:tetratricopeptide (TPR) repeat protein